MPWLDKRQVVRPWERARVMKGLFVVCQSMIISFWWLCPKHHLRPLLYTASHEPYPRFFHSVGIYHRAIASSDASFCLCCRFLWWALTQSDVGVLGPLLGTSQWMSSRRWPRHFHLFFPCATKSLRPVWNALCHKFPRVMCSLARESAWLFSCPQWSREWKALVSSWWPSTCKCMLKRR